MDKNRHQFKLSNEGYEQLKGYLCIEFPKLDLSQIEDAIADTLLELQRYDFPEAMLYITAKRRCMDICRKRTRLDDLVDVEMIVSPVTNSPEPFVKEKRGHQHVALIEVTRRFVQWAESSKLKLQSKECFERMANFQSNTEISRAMKLPMKTVQRRLQSAVLMYRKTLAEIDPNKEIFSTIMSQKAKEKRGVNPFFGGINDEDAVTPKHTTEDSGSGGTQLNINDEIQISTTDSSKPIPRVKDFGEIAIWVLKHTAALCPTETRLQQFSKAPNGSRFSDVTYHVIHCQCHFCGDALNAMQTP